MPKSTCLICGASPGKSRGLCTPCYYHARHVGELETYPRKKRSFAEHLEIAKSNETADGCWPWPGALSEGGYAGSVTFGGRVSAAHIASWVQANGPVPAGMELDHLCHTYSESCLGGGTCLHRRCVRACHLEPVTRLEQQRRRKDFQSPTCKNGHDRAEHSVMQQHSSDGKWYRHCVLCRKNNHHARYLRSLRKT